MQNLWPLSDDEPTLIGKDWKVLGRLPTDRNKRLYVAENDSHKVVIKILSSEDEATKDDWDSWSQEVSILQELKSSKVSRLIDYDFSDTNLPWIATEFIGGETLEEIVLREGALKLEDWNLLCRNLTETLKELHESGILHRDISPANIIYFESQYFLIDFGMAVTIDKKNNLSEFVGGTLPTISPEHLLENNIPEMDIFSLGATLVFAGSGHYPFKGYDLDSQKIIDNDAKISNWASTVLYELPNLDGLIRYQANLIKPMLYKNPRKRIPSKELLEVVSDYSASEPKHVNNPKRKLNRYLLLATRKLRGKSPFYAKKRRLTQASLLVGFVLFLGFGVISGLFREVKASYSERQILDCVKFLKVNDIQSATTQCLKDFNEGKKDAAPYLAMSYRAQELDNESKRVLLDCTNVNSICKALYFAWYSNSPRANDILKKAYDSGFGPASYLLARKYFKEKNPTESKMWAKKGHEAGVPISSLYYAVTLYNEESFDEALDIAMNLKIRREDLIWDSVILEYDNISERLVQAILAKADRFSEIKPYLLNCASLGNPYCMGELALLYRAEEDWENASIWAGRGSERGDGAAMFVMAKYYRYLNSNYSQTFSEKQNATQIFEWMKKSANTGFIPALQEVGGTYLLATFVTNSDEAQDSFDENVKAGCIWYMKSLIAVENEKKRGWSTYLYGDEIEYKDSFSGLLNSFNCTAQINPTPSLDSGD